MGAGSSSSSQQRNDEPDDVEDDGVGGVYIDTNLVQSLERRAMAIRRHQQAEEAAKSRMAQLIQDQQSLLLGVADQIEASKADSKTESENVQEAEAAFPDEDQSGEKQTAGGGSDEQAQEAQEAQADAEAGDHGVMSEAATDLKAEPSSEDQPETNSAGGEGVPQAETDIDPIAFTSRLSDAEDRTMIEVSKHLSSIISEYDRPPLESPCAAFREHTLQCYKNNPNNVEVCFDVLTALEKCTRENISKVG